MLKTIKPEHKLAIISIQRTPVRERFLHLQSNIFVFSSLDKKEPDVDLSRGLPMEDLTARTTAKTLESSMPSPAVMGQISGVSTTTVTVSSPVPELGVDTLHVDKLRSALNRVNDWGLDTFLIEELSGQRPLTAITYRIFQERSLLRTYGIEPHTLISYLLTLEDHYQQVPYHNKAHGADVCQSMHVLLNASALEVRKPRSLLFRFSSSSFSRVFSRN